MEAQKKWIKHINKNKTQIAHYQRLICLQKKNIAEYQNIIVRRV